MSNNRLGNSSLFQGTSLQLASSAYSTNSLWRNVVISFITWPGSILLLNHWRHGCDIRSSGYGFVSKVCRRPESERTSHPQGVRSRHIGLYVDAGQRSGWLVQPLEARHPEFSDRASDLRRAVRAVRLTVSPPTSTTPTIPYFLFAHEYRDGYEL